MSGEAEADFEKGVAFLAFSPLGRGFLTGKMGADTELEKNDWRRSNPRFQKEALARNHALIDEVKRVADEARASVGQVALAWALAARGPKPAALTPRNCGQSPAVAVAFSNTHSILSTQIAAAMRIDFLLEFAVAHAVLPYRNARLAGLLPARNAARFMVQGPLDARRSATRHKPADS